MCSNFDVGFDVLKVKIIKLSILSVKSDKTSETAMSGADEVQYYNLLPPPVVPGSHDLASSSRFGH